MKIDDFLIVFQRLTLLQKWFAAFAGLLLLAGLFLCFGCKKNAIFIANLAFVCLVVAIVVRVKEEFKK